MARTGQPAVRHVAAVERAFTVLDALADGGELGTNEIARRTGINASTVSRLLATLASARFVEHVPETGRYRLVAAAGRARQRGARAARPPRARPARTCRRSCARPARRRRCRPPGSTTRSRVDFAHSSSVVQSVAQLGRPSVGHATAVGKVMLAFGDVELPAEPLDGVHAAHDHDPRAARRGARAGSQARLRRGAGGARGGPRGGRRARCGTAGASSPGSSASRGPPRGSTRGRVKAAVPVLVEHAAAVSVAARLARPDRAA